MKRTGIVFAAAVALLTVGCAPKQEAQAGATQSLAIKHYQMHGKVISVNAAEKSAKIEGADIPGWMSAMTMDYPVKDASELPKLAADKMIEATVFVEGDNFWIGEIKDAAPAPAEHKK